MKPYQRYILFSLILIGSILLFFVFGNDITLQGGKHIDTILSHGSSEEEAIFEESIQDDLPDTLLKSLPSDLSQVIVNSFDVDDLKIGVGNPSLDQLLPLYKKQKSPEILRYIVQKAINNYEFQFALDLLAQESLDDALDAVGIETYIYLMFNEQELNFVRINRIKEVLIVMHNASYISDIQFEHYLGLIALSRGDIDNRFYFLGQVGSEDEFLSRKIESEKMRTQVNSYKDVPDYYLKTLLGSVLYRKQYIRISQKLASDIIANGDGYILPHQLVAYSSVLLKDYAQAQESLKWLLENDISQKKRYNFLLGVSLHEQGEYAQSVFHFQSLSHSSFREDAQKYLFLIYQELDDTKRLMKLMKEIISRGNISNEEYIGFFDELFWSDVEKTKYYIEYMDEDIDMIMEHCYRYAEYKQVCMYGKAGLFYQLGQYHNAYKYLIRVVDSVYNTRIFIHLANISELLGNDVLAKKRYVWALRVSESDDLSTRIKSSLQNVLDNI